MRAALRLALSDLAHDRLRALFSAAGIAAVVLGALLLNALAAGLADFLEGAPVSSNLLVIDATFIDPSDSSLPPQLEADLRAWTPEPLRRVSPLLYRQLRIDGRMVQLRAADPADWEPVYRLSLAAGRWPARLDEVMVGEGAAAANGWQVGQPLVIFGETFQVCAIFRAAGTGFSAVWMTRAAAQELFGAQRGVQALTLMLAPGADPAAVSARLQELPALAGKYGVLLEDSYTRRNGQVVRDLQGLIRLVSLLALLAVPLSTASLTLLALAERARVLGILRALGFSQWQVRWFLVWRAALVAAAAGLLGLGGAWAALAQLSAQGEIFLHGVPFRMELSAELALQMLAAVLGFALLGALAASGRGLRAAVGEMLRE